MTVVTRYSGEYDCEIEADSDRPISVTHKLDILIPPQIYSEPADGNIMFVNIWTTIFTLFTSQYLLGNVVVKKGSSVAIRCSATGNPRPHVSWSKVHEVEVLGQGEVMELAQVNTDL